jgi:ABC-type glycerol-3-phosphate transport system permease component
MPHSLLRRLGVPGLSIIACTALAFPFLWMISTSLKGPQELNDSNPSLVPRELVGDNYHDVVVQGHFGHYFLNSVVVATGTTILAVALACLSGYAFARFRLPGGKALLLGILATQMFPSILLAIPLYVTLRTLNLLDTHLGLILVYTTFALPFSVWMLRNYFMNIPRELDEAAMVDGCTRLQALWRVVLPMARPGIAAVAVFNLILAWDEFLYANTFLNTESKRTLSVGLQSLIGEFSTNWGLLMAGTVITAVPIVVLFMFFQRQLTQMVSGGVKG